MATTVTGEVRAAEQTATIAAQARRWADQIPDRVAMRHKDLGIWQDITWGQL